jgi:sugar phosphate isomerase/epimerase
VGDADDGCGCNAETGRREPEVITRRAFVAATAASCCLPLTAAGRLNLGIGTYSYHSLSMDEMVVQLKKLRISQIEMSRGEFMLFSKPAPELFRSARTRFDNAGIQCVSYYTATIKDDRDLDDAVRGATLLGSGNITGDATGDVLRRIDERCTKEGLTFGIHNHYFKEKFEYESPEDVLRGLAGRSGTMGASLDIGHIASCGFDTVDAVRKLGPYLKMVHLKDVQAAGGEINVPLGRGIARIPEVMRELKKIDYRGLVAIEYEHEGAVEKDVRSEVDYARKLL